MPTRPLHLRIGWTLRDYAKRVWDNSGEDNIFFLAGGIAFNLLLAVVPFVLLFASALAYLLNQSAEASSAEINEIIYRFLPASEAGGDSPLGKLLIDIVRSRQAIGIYSVIGFVWFSTFARATLKRSVTVSETSATKSCAWSPTLRARR